MTTYQIRYLGEIIEEDEFATDDEARAWRQAFVSRIMADEMPWMLTSDDFDGDFDACLQAHRLVRLGLTAREESFAALAAACESIS